MKSPIAKRTVPFAVSPRISKPNHREFLQFEQIKYAGAIERHFLNGSNGVRVTHDKADFCRFLLVLVCLRLLHHNRNITDAPTHQLIRCIVR